MRARATKEYFKAVTGVSPREVRLDPTQMKDRLSAQGVYAAEMPREAGDRRPRGSIATIAVYGPTLQTPTKIAVAMMQKDSDDEPTLLERWVAPDILSDLGIQEKIREFLREHPVRQVTMTGGVVGCPHEEGEDFPEGGDCPLCPAWRGRQGSGASEEPVP